MMYKITIIPGDGIGIEVTEAGEYLLDKLDLEFKFTYAQAGYSCYQNTGYTLPDETVKKALKSDAVLFGAITSTPNQPSPIINLRKKLDTYANLRPIKSYKGVKSLHENIDILIVRENTEGLYSQNEYEIDEKLIAERVITRKASEKISKTAFEQCQELGKNKVTCVHKSNVLKKTDGVFKECFYKIGENYPQIEKNDFYIDAAAMYMVTRPTDYQVIVASNLFGDILSDEGAGLVGGLGLAPSGNIGDEHGLFEPVHGSAPDIAGKNIANPCSMILSIAMMMNYLKEHETAKIIDESVSRVLEKGKVKTPDLGGTASTMEMTKEIVKEIENA